MKITYQACDLRGAEWRNPAFRQVTIDDLRMEVCDDCHADYLIPVELRRMETVKNIRRSEKVVGESKLSGAT